LNCIFDSSGKAVTAKDRSEFLIQTVVTARAPWSRVRPQTSAREYQHGITPEPQCRKVHLDSSLQNFEDYDFAPRRRDSCGTTAPMLNEARSIAL
jgi:hypothetical protein